MELDETNIFTGIPEMDTMILHELDDKTLYNMAQVNMYVYGLLMNNNILRNRIHTYLNRLVQTVINPRTGRPVRVGSPAYNQLIRQYGAL